MLEDLTVTDVYVRECIDLDGDFRWHLAHFENVGVTWICPDLGRKMWWLALRKDEEVEVEKGTYSNQQVGRIEAGSRKARRPSDLFGQYNICST